MEVSDVSQAPMDRKRPHARLLLDIVSILSISKTHKRTARNVCWRESG